MIKILKIIKEEVLKLLIGLVGLGIIGLIAVGLFALVYNYWAYIISSIEILVILNLAHSLGNDIRGK